MDMKDPRVELVTVTGAKVSDDLRHAIIFYSVMGDEKRWAEVAQGLKSCRGYVKKELGKRLKMKYLPDLKFVEDRTMEKGAKMDRLLSGLVDNE